MPNPFDDIICKLDRAYEHTKACHEVAKAFFESDFYTRRAEIDRKGRDVLRAVEVTPPPARLGVLVGDAVHQLRSSLDHLLFILARPTPKQERDVQFPLVPTREAFRGTRTMMPGVARGVRTVIEGLQPYHRRKRPEVALLHRIHAISKWDKHHALTTASGVIVGSTMHLRAPDGSTLISETTFKGILKTGTILGRFEMAHLREQANVYVTPELVLVPVFDARMPKPIAGCPVIQTLSDARKFIQNGVLPMFERFV